MKDAFKYQAMLGPDDLARYLRALADGVEAGELTVAENGHAFALNPLGLMGLTVKARRKEGRSRVSFDIDWGHEPADGDDDGPAGPGEDGVLP